MEKRKDCMTCFYNGTNLGSFPCVRCTSFNLWTDKDAFKEEKEFLVFHTGGKEINIFDSVHKPKHYNVGIEPIEAIESWKLGYNLGNVIKYVARADHKGKRIEDLKKARWYLDREINKNESDI